VIECNFCDNKDPNYQPPQVPPSWFRVDIDLFVCPGCVPNTMSPIDATLDYSSEDAEIANDYYNKHYQK